MRTGKDLGYCCNVDDLSEECLGDCSKPYSAVGNLYFAKCPRASDAAVCLPINRASMQLSGNPELMLSTGLEATQSPQFVSIGKLTNNTQATKTACAYHVNLAPQNLNVSVRFSSIRGASVSIYSSTLKYADPTAIVDSSGSKNITANKMYTMDKSLTILVLYDEASTDPSVNFAFWAGGRIQAT